MTTAELAKINQQKYYQLKRQEDQQYGKLIEMLHGHGERYTCSVFGCGKTLSIREQLFGNKCINHSIENEIKNETL